MDIIEAFATLQRHGHVSSQYEFDNRWLGKSCGYYSYLKSTSSMPSIETLARLHFRLLAAHEIYVVYGVATDELKTLAIQIMEEIRLRCA